MVAISVQVSSTNLLWWALCLAQSLSISTNRWVFFCVSTTASAEIALMSVLLLLLLYLSQFTAPVETALVSVVLLLLLPLCQ